MWDLVAPLPSPSAFSLGGSGRTQCPAKGQVLVNREAPLIGKVQAASFEPSRRPRMRPFRAPGDAGVGATQLATTAHLGPLGSTKGGRFAFPCSNPWSTGSEFGERQRQSAKAIRRKLRRAFLATPRVSRWPPLKVGKAMRRGLLGALWTASTCWWAASSRRQQAKPSGQQRRQARRPIHWSRQRFRAGHSTTSLTLRRSSKICSHPRQRMFAALSQVPLPRRRRARWKARHPTHLSMLLRRQQPERAPQVSEKKPRVRQATARQMFGGEGSASDAADVEDFATPPPPDSASWAIQDGQRHLGRQGGGAHPPWDPGQLLVVRGHRCTGCSFLFPLCRATSDRELIALCFEVPEAEPGAWSATSKDFGQRRRHLSRWWREKGQASGSGVRGAWCRWERAPSMRQTTRSSVWQDPQRVTRHLGASAVGALAPALCAHTACVRAK